MSASDRIQTMGRSATLAIGVAMVLTACSDAPPPPPVTKSTLTTAAVYYTDPAEQAAFRAALDRASIPYRLEMRGGNEMVLWQAQYDPQVQKIRAELFGADIRTNSNVTFGDAEKQEAFVDWLGKRGVKYEVVRSRGKDYVVWEGPETLSREFMQQFPSKCNDAVARANSKAGTCG